jgi:phosphatidate cytidylyltransferase
MNLYGLVTNPYFWAYAVSAGVLLAAAWAVLFLWKQQENLADLRRVFWTWVGLVAVTTLAILLGKEVFALAIALLSVLACREFARVTGLYEDWTFTGLVYVAILGVNLVALWPGYDVFMATPIYAVAALCVLPVVRNRTEGMLQRVALSVMAFVYFGYFLAHLSLLYAVTEDRALAAQAAGARENDVYGYIFFLIYGTATADLAGWLAGRWIGGHALAPRISGSATWERLGVSLAWGLLWSFTLGRTLPEPHFTGVAMLLSGILFGVMGPLGDLVMRYVLHDLSLKAQAPSGSELVPYLALEHLNRFIFVAPLFLRLVHWFHRDLFQPPGGF